MSRIKKRKGGVYEKRYEDLRQIKTHIEAQQIILREIIRKTTRIWRKINLMIRIISEVLKDVR
jgi:hypothetical protein